MMKPKSVRAAQAQISPEIQAEKDAMTQLFFKTEGKGGVGVAEYNKAAEAFNGQVADLGLSGLRMVLLDETGKVKI